MSSLSDLIDSQSGSGQSGPLAGRQVIPFSDLDALNLPDQLGSLSNDLISAIAVLAAQGPTGGRLLNANAQGSLYAASNINFPTTVSAHANVGDTHFTVVDPTWPAQAGWFWVIQIPAHGGSTSGPYFSFPGTDPHTVTLGVALALSVDVGDIVFPVPRFNLLGTNNFVQLSPNQINLPISPSQGPDGSVGGTDTVYGRRRMMVDTARSADWSQLASIVSPGAAIVTQPAPGSGFRLVVKDMMITLDNRSGAGLLVNVRVWDGPSGTGTLRWFTTMSVANNAIEKLPVHDLLHKMSDNTQLNVDFSGNVANSFQTIYVNGYIEG